MRLRLANSPAIAAELDAARRQRRAIAPPAELAGLSLRDAYDVQDAVAAARERAGARRSGWKLGLTSGVKQQLMGIDRPLFGRLFIGDSEVDDGPVAFASCIQPRVEPELAFGLIAPLDPDIPINAQMHTIEWFAPALEITDSRYQPGARTAVELVADNTSAAAYAIGPRIAFDAATRLDTFATRLIRNGSVLAEGVTGDVLGNPLTALTLLARHLTEHGLQTSAGDIVLSGAITDAFAAAAGDVFEAQFDGCGSAAVTFV